MLGRILMLGLVGVLAVPGLVAAQSQRSMMRTLGGVGLMAGGVVIAFWEQDCRVAGSLSEDLAVSIEFANRVGSVGILFDDARNPVSSKMSGRCDLDWTVNTYVGLELFGRLANLESTGARQANALRGEFPKLDDTRGSARAEAYWPTGRLYAGIGMAAVGALLATVWADVPDVSLSLEPGGARLSKTFGF